MSVYLAPYKKQSTKKMSQGMLHLSTQVLQAPLSRKIKLLYYFKFETLYIRLSYIKEKTKIILIHDIDDQTTKCISVSEGTQAVHLNPNL